jgi:Gram-negative porin
MTLNKKVLAGLVALAAAGTAQSATLVAEDGWEVKVGGLINQFVTFSDYDNRTSGDVNEVRDGLLPAFLNFDFKAPTMNGLDIAAHISFSPSTNQDSYGAGEQREVYFTVDGSFGQVLAGKALGLYGSHNILTDQTLWGVGYGTSGNGTTTLGGIGLGYDYAAWRSQVRWTSNDMNGFKIALAVLDNGGPSIGLTGANGGKPTGGLVTGAADSEDLRYEIDLSYAGTIDNGSYSAWVSAMHQGDDIFGSNTDQADDESAWTVGGTLVLGGFEAMVQYSDAEGSAAGVAGVASAAAVAESGSIAGGDYVPASAAVAGTVATSSSKTEWEQYIVQAGYRFNGTTLVSASYADLEDKKASSDDSIDRITVGVYHDVNANLKLVAEYTQVEDDTSNSSSDVDIYSLGGFVFF